MQSDAISEFRIVPSLVGELKIKKDMIDALQKERKKMFKALSLTPSLNVAYLDALNYTSIIN